MSGEVAKTAVLVTIALAAFMQLVSGLTDAAIGLNPHMSVPVGAASWPSSSSQGTLKLSDLIQSLKSGGMNNDDSAAGTRAAGATDSTDSQPAWLAQVSVQCGARLSAAVASAAVLVPFILIAIIMYYAVVNKPSAPKFKTSLPVAAIWTTVVAAVFSMVANFIVTAGALTDAANTGSFTPVAFEAPTSFGVSSTNLALSVVAVCVTIAALVKQ